MEAYLVGLIACAGALAYNAWGFFKAYAATKETSMIEVWSPTKTLLTLVPSLAAAFVAAATGQLTVTTPGDIVAIAVAGFGFASIGSKLGIDSFFEEKKAGGK